MAFGFVKGQKNSTRPWRPLVPGVSLELSVSVAKALHPHLTQPTSQPWHRAGHSTLPAVWHGREMPSKQGFEGFILLQQSLQCPHDQGLNSQQMNLSLKLFRRKLQVASRAVWGYVRELSVQLCFVWFPEPSKMGRNLSGAGSLWDLPNLSCSAWKFLLWTLWEKLMCALILAGGAKPAAHYLHSHKRKCSIAFRVSLGLEPLLFPFCLQPQLRTHPCYSREFSATRAAFVFVQAPATIWF